MSVRVSFHCDGCDAKAEGTDSLRVEFRGFSGRDHGVGVVRPVNRVSDLAPHGWIAYDPYTYATYCPKCWEEIAASVWEALEARARGEEPPR